MELNAVGEGEAVGSSTCVGQPVVVDIVEEIGFSVHWVEQVPGSESQTDIFAESFRQAEVQGGGGLLVNVRRSSFGHQEQFLPLDVEAGSCVHFGAVVRVREHGVHDVRLWPNNGRVSG